jgi:hypothetical protein
VRKKAPPEVRKKAPSEVRKPVMPLRHEAADAAAGKLRVVDEEHAGVGEGGCRRGEESRDDWVRRRPESTRGGGGGSTDGGSGGIGRKKKALEA